MTLIMRNSGSGGISEPHKVNLVLKSTKYGIPGLVCLYKKLTWVVYG